MIEQPENLSLPSGFQSDKLSLSDIYRLMDLRTLERNLKGDLLSKGHLSYQDRDEIIWEKAMLMAVRKEIKARERRHFFIEFAL